MCPTKGEEKNHMELIWVRFISVETTVPKVLKDG
jgi:hypothetical protein